MNAPGSESLFKASSFRLFLEGEVDRLLAILDAIAGDPDLEDSDIEDENEDGGDILDQPPVRV